MKGEMKNPIKDEKKDKKGRDSARVKRGGSRFYFLESVHVSYRDYYPPAILSYDVGFRIVRNKQ